MAAHDPVLQRVCLDSSQLALRVRSALQQSRSRTGIFQRGIVAEGARRKAARWLNQMSNRLLPILDRFPPRELDLLVGCLARVEHAIGQETLPFRRLKAAAAARMRSSLI